MTTLRRTLSELIKSFPADEKYRLINQIRRAARSAANIAEGYGRFHYQENVQYCRQTRGSLFELIEHLIVANDEGYISDEQLTSLKKGNRFVLGSSEWVDKLSSQSAKQERARAGSSLLGGRHFLMRP